MTETTGRSGYVIFRPRARLLRLIGAELISDDVVAITELVKNAHDADALTVTVQFRGVTRPGGSVTVTDDGCGMDLDTLLRHWMEPAGTSKAGSGRQRTRRGRRVLGEKGIGRFAVDKLARRLELVSRHHRGATEVRATFDWDRFDSETEMLSAIRNRWEVRPATEIVGNGTVLKMTDLRTLWNERMFRRLSTRLARLRSPFQGVDSFAIRIESDEFPEYSGEIRPELLEKAPYRIEAAFDGFETIEVCVNNGRRSRHPWNGTGPLSCGPVRVRLYAFDLEGEAVARIGPRMEVRGWLREWSGVSIYRDGFRVWPYGEPHDDWLRLDQRRVNSPVVRLSNNQVVGFVEISNDGNAELRDQTSREGLIHNPSFEDLRRLMYFVLQTLEAERQLIRHPRLSGQSSSAGSKNREDALPAALEDLARRANGQGPELSLLARKLRDTQDREHRIRRAFIEGHAELAALGHVAQGLCLGLRLSLEVARNQSRALGFAGPGQRGSVKSLAALLDSISLRVDLITAGGGSTRRRAIDVVAELRRVRGLLDPVLEPAGVRMTVGGPRLVRADMRPENFQRLICILALNSIEWLRSVKEPEIRVTVRVQGDRCEIRFSDNGPGIAKGNSERIFEPLFSGKEGGRGMGLAIARSLVLLHGGTIETVMDHANRGAHFRVLLPRKRSRATLTTA